MLEVFEAYIFTSGYEYFFTFKVIAMLRCYTSAMVALLDLFGSVLFLEALTRNELSDSKLHSQFLL